MTEFECKHNLPTGRQAKLLASFLKTPTVEDLTFEQAPIAFGRNMYADKSLH